MASPFVTSEFAAQTGSINASFSDIHIVSSGSTCPENTRIKESPCHVIDIRTTDEEDLAEKTIAAMNISVQNSTSDADCTVTYFGSDNSQGRHDDSGLLSKLSQGKSNDQEFVVRYTSKPSLEGAASVDISTTSVTSNDMCQLSIDEDKPNQMLRIDRSNSCTRLLSPDDAVLAIKHSPQSSVFLVNSSGYSSIKSCVYQDASAQTEEFPAVEASLLNKGVDTLTIQGSSASLTTIDIAHKSMTSSINERTIIMREDDIDLALIFLPHMVASCIAMWCCGCIFGCIGFVLAVFGSRASNEGDHGKSKRLSRASLACAVLGITTGLLAVILLLFAVLGVFGEASDPMTTPAPRPTQPPIRPPFFY